MHAQRLTVVLALLLTVPGLALAQDVTRPAEVAGLVADIVGADVQIGWDAVTEDAAGNAETIDHYKIYRGDTPDFVPDKATGSNLVGTSTTETFDDPGVAADANSYFYLISAVDTAGNESDTKPSSIPTLPVISGFWTASTIEVDWTEASPAVDVVSYRVYYGKGSRQYEAVVDVGLATSHTLSGLAGNTNWYVTVTAIDTAGNETPFTNEHVDALNGTIRLNVHSQDELCWGDGGADCAPADPEKIQRSNGWQLLVPTVFPEGDWVSVTVSLTMDSRLCTPPAQGTVTKCGPGNPCVSPPCNGGYNPCGDPWDRLAHLFVVLDEECLEGTGSCITHNNLELIRAVTPFGSDAESPDGTGTIPPRRLTMDITPYANLLRGPMYVGVEIGHFVQKGHWVTTDFVFTERPAAASPKPPADGIEIVGFGGFAGVERQVTIPPTATDVKMRLFTTGHGGNYACTGGSANGDTCAGPGAFCAGGGVCNPCDEFCARTNQIIADGTPIWEAIPFRSDCNASPGCQSWNACGFPSCTFPRAGWCPGYIACHHNAPCDNDLDMSVDLPAGGTYDIDYNVTPLNGSWPVSLVLYWYE